MKVINFRLMAHWENWATVLLMLLIATFAINSLTQLVIHKDGVN